VCFITDIKKCYLLKKILIKNFVTKTLYKNKKAVGGLLFL
jgi:hypothetical protein